MGREQLDGRAPRAIAPAIPLHELKKIFADTRVMSLRTMNILERWGFTINVTKSELPDGERIMRAIASGDLSRGVGALPEEIYRFRNPSNQLTLKKRAELASLSIQLGNVNNVLAPVRVSRVVRANSRYIQERARLVEERNRLSAEINTYVA